MLSSLRAEAEHVTSFCKGTDPPFGWKDIWIPQELFVPLTALESIVETNGDTDRLVVQVLLKGRALLLLLTGPDSVAYTFLSDTLITSGTGIYQYVTLSRFENTFKFN